METLNRFTAPATARIRQLQKLVQDIKRNDGSLLDKLRRLKGKARPNVPARDYRADDRDFDQSSDPDYDNETYEDPHDDNSYEPPPSHREFTTHLPSLPRGEYLGSCPERPSRPPKKPVRPGKASKELPPKPSHVQSDEEDYVDPDVSVDDDYVEPSQNPTPNLMTHGGNRGGRIPHALPASLPERPPSPDFYEVPDNKEVSTSPTNRLCPVPVKSYSLPKPCPRRKTSQLPIQEAMDEDEYEVCHPHDGGPPPPPLLQKPSPKERSPKPQLVPKPDLKTREFESKTFPAVQSEQKASLKVFSLDRKRPKIPVPHFTSSKAAEKVSVAVGNMTTDQNMDADVYNKPWFASACDRRTADDALLRSNKDGAFMVRKSSGHDAQQPYTLVVFYNSRVYNIPIRFLPATQQYALGREKKGEEYFSSISHIIENHQKNSLVLIDSQSNTKDATKLCYPVRP